MLIRWLLPAIGSFALSGCGKSPEPAPQSEPAIASGTEAVRGHATPLACDMVTQAEMSAIVGGEMVAKNNDRSNGKTECIYSSVKEAGPYVELSVSWGDGQAAMAGVGFLESKEPGIASPYDGLGDQAIAVGPTLMIKTGEDLMQIVFSGVDDVPDKARQIFTTAKGRM
jgi:hypothetical protein